MNFLPDDSDAFQQEALASEKLGTWSKTWLNLAKQKKLFHLVVPNKYGGHQLPIPDLLPILEKASYFDGSFGWTLTLGAGAGVFGAYMHPEFAREQFTNPGTFITGSGYPSGTASLGNHNLVANGKWKYATGAPHATLFTAPCALENSTQEKVLTFYPDEVAIKKSWNSYGLKATASHDFEVNNITVPIERVFTIDPNFLVIDEPLYRFPFDVFASCTLASSLTGMARRFLDEAAVITVQRNDQSAPVKSQLGKSHAQVNQQKKRLEDVTGEAWKECQQGHEVTETNQQKIAQTAKALTSESLKQANRWYLRCGMQVLDEKSIANRAWRNLNTACQHMLLNPTQK